jgi:hypothetical protein
MRNPRQADHPAGITLGKAMNTRHLIVAAGLFAAGSSLAQQTEFIQPDATFHSTLTRAEVRQQIGDGFVRNDLDPLQLEGQTVRYVHGTRTRAEVRAEAASFRQSREAASGLDLSKG